MGFEFSCDSTFIWVAAIISIFVFCALFLDGIGDFFGKLIGLVTLGGVFGIVFGAFGWLAATLIFSLSASFIIFVNGGKTKNNEKGF